MDTHGIFKAELALSLDVIYHLVEDRIFEIYMTHLFYTAEKFVIIYSSNMSVNPLLRHPYLKHRCFTEWVRTNFSKWILLQQTPNKYPYEGDIESGSFASFFIYKKV